jgi:hypothetical protein
VRVIKLRSSFFGQRNQGDFFADGFKIVHGVLPVRVSLSQESQESQAIFAGGGLNR